MNPNRAFLFPGQGAQYVGMGKDFYEQFMEAREVFQEADDTLGGVLGFTLSSLIFGGPADLLTRTKNSQIAIFIVSIALMRVLEKQLPQIRPSVTAGLSLGEYSAIVAAKKISFREALHLVYHRAAYMEEACIRYPGTMRVVLGLDEASIQQVLAREEFANQVWIANLNCPGQVVIAGKIGVIDQVAEELKTKGAKRVLPIDVSGAFHSGLMQDARDLLEIKIAEISLRDSDIDLVMNIPGGYVESLSVCKENLIAQVTGTVRFEQGIRAMLTRGVSSFIEIGCGSTLSSIVKRIGVPSESVHNLDKVSDLEKLSRSWEGACCC